MKLTALRIDRFGAWRDLSLGDLSPTLNVFFGRNEAGKTTLLDFTRGMLFGLSPERLQRYDGAVPIADSRGGEARLIAADRAWRIARFARPGEAEVARLIDDADEAAPLERWNQIVGRVGEGDFERVFAVGLREMQELGTLSDSEAGALLYELTCGAKGRAAAAALADVRQTRAALASADPNSSQIAALLAERKRLRAALAASRGEISQWGKRREALAALDRKIDELQAAEAAARESLREWEAAHDARDLWTALAALPASDDRPGGLSTEALVEFEELSARGRRLRRAIRRAAALRQKLRGRRGEWGELKQHPEAVERLGLLLEQREAMLLGERQLEELQSEARRLKAAAPVAPAPVVSSSTIAPEKARRVRVAGRRLSQARMAHEQAQREAQHAQEQHRAVAGELQRNLQGRNSADVARAIEHAGQHVHQAKRRLQIEERLTRMERQRSELEEQMRELLDRHVLGYWTLGWLGGLFICGVALILAGMFLPQSVTGMAGIWLALLGIVGIGASVAARHLMEQSAENQLEAARAQVHLLQRQTDQAHRERDELDAQLPKDGGPMTRRLDQAEEELARYENLLPLESRVRGAEQAAAAATETAERARRELDSAQAAWREALRGAGLSVDLTPQDARELVREPAPVALPPADLGYSERLARVEAELALRQRERDHWAARIAQALADWRVTSPEATLSGKLDQLAALRRGWHERHAGRRRWLRSLRRASLRLRKLRRRLARIASERRRLLLAAGVSTPEAFRLLADRISEAAKQAQTREHLRRQFLTLCAAAPRPEAIERLLREHSAADVARRLAAARQSVEQLERQLAEARGDRQRMLGEFSGPQAFDHDQTRVELSLVSERLRQALSRWRTATLAERALAAQLRRYEADHQPLTLRQASKYFERLTAKRYTRVWAAIEPARLMVDAADGRTLPASALSRGTREQLYLALRLAIVDDYARRGVELPLVLDDVLVNFDDERARCAAETLIDYAASGRQVFVLSCHEHIARAFDEAGAAVRDLSAGGAPWRNKAPKAELPPPTPAPVLPQPAAPPQRAPERRPTKLRRPRRRVHHAMPVLPMPRPTRPTIVPRPLEAAPRRIEPAPRVRYRWIPWNNPNGAEEFVGEFTERVFS